MSGDKFLECYGVRRLKFLEVISSEEKRREIIQLVDEIKSKALIYGYGPVKARAMLFVKS
jgi:hypothetical protein